MLELILFLNLCNETCVSNMIVTQFTKEYKFRDYNKCPFETVLKILSYCIKKREKVTG